MRSLIFKSKYSVLSSIVLTLALLLSSGCSVETQKAKESFADEALPKELNKLANQSYELARYHDQIVQRVQTENKAENLSVAVIDNGMDIAHPDLINKFDYEISNNEITGVGYDIMGADHFPSAVLINPELFAFSAKEIKNGLIVKGDGNAFKELISLNDEFTKLFLENLHKDEILSKSLFNKITAKSFNMFTIYNIFSKKDGEKNYFDEEQYKKNKEEHKLITPNFRLEATDNTELQKNSLNTIYAIFDSPADTNNINFGSGSLFYYLQNIENGDLFFALMKKTYSDFTRFNELTAGINRLVDFRLGRKHSLSIDRESEISDAINFLTQALEYQLNGNTIVDPILSVASVTQSNLLTDLDFIRQPSIYPVAVFNEYSVQQSLISSFNKLSIYDSIVAPIEKNTSEQFAYKDFTKNALISKKVALAFLKTRENELKKLFEPNFKSEFSSLYRKYNFRNKHPYLSAVSADESHGTHTSGIVAKQNEHIRIYPVRITTRSALVTKEEKQRLIDNYSQDFQKWLHQPIVVKAIYQKLAKLRPITITSEPQTAADRDVFAQKVYEILTPGMQIAFEDDPLNFIFFKELEEAMVLVAQKNIKIASISLGAEFNKKLPQLKDLDPELDIAAVFSYLNFEFFKYQIADILTNKAQNTLFVIAAGNSSTWVDGNKHSALPVDLTSRFLASFENGQDLVAPNNHIKNILGVGSLSQDEDLSDFTNILLGLKTRIIFAIGEDVLSPIKSTDLSSSLSVINKRIPGLSQPFSLNDSRLKDKVFENANFMQLKNKDDGLYVASNYLSAGFQNLGTAVSAMKFQLALTYSDHREHFSGTSMATPAVAGTIAGLVLDKAKAMNLSTTEIYNNPEFTPEKLIEAAFATSKPLFDDSPEVDLRKIDVRGKYDRGDQVQALDKYLDQVLK